MNRLLTLCAILPLISNVNSYSSGAPSQACRVNSKPKFNVHMTPGHAGITLEKENPQATLAVKPLGNGQLEITLSSARKFEGEL